MREAIKYFDDLSAELADVFMSEYGIGLQDFLQNYPINQIKILSEKIKQRRTTHLRELLSIIHPKDPAEMDKLLSKGTKRYNVKRVSELTQVEKTRFNIREIRMPKEKNDIRGSSSSI
ncbi:MAG TPA: hypothetical protein PLE33_05790 [Candidatus Cloacimonas sp.]|nr:hypothetical protein [Candidatus Cloacimonas sp.]HPS60756.1 hypothetical protein [Candidatus Cloacimonas sp.]